MGVRDTVTSYGRLPKIAPPPTYQDVHPQVETTRTSARPSTSARGAPQYEEDVPEVAIAVMGATGSGKTTFINLVSGSEFGIGKGLRSCTDAVQIAGSFFLDGRRVILIDTPGFDDTSKSDTDVLKLIAAFLETSYHRGNKLAGVLYFHRISDFRMTGISRKNFSMFRKLCGDSALRNVIIVTNMWGEVKPDVGDEREAELISEDMFFKPVLEKGAQMARHLNTVPSAEKIIRLILNNHPIPLRIQEELVNEHKDISETGAGEELNREINAQIRRHQEEMRILKGDMEQAMKDKDEETRKELEIETQRMQREIEKFQHDSARLESDYKKEKERLDSRMEKMELEAKKEAERVAAEYKRQMDELRDSLKNNTQASERERAQWVSQIGDLTKRIDDNRRRGWFSRLGEAIDNLF